MHELVTMSVRLTLSTEVRVLRHLWHWQLRGWVLANAAADLTATGGAHGPMTNDMGGGEDTTGGGDQDAVGRWSAWG
jgi:hypothetical protein